MRQWLVLLVMMAATSTQSATYYIDYENGLDGNNGQSKTTAWKRHPYMYVFAGTFTHQPGDSFIFKGGVTWLADALPLHIWDEWNVVRGGAAGHPDYYGVDRTWYSGAAWSRPKFDGQYQLLPTGSSNIAIDHTGYIILDNLEVTRHLATVNCGPGNISVSQVDSITIKNCYIHGWDLSTSITTDDAHGGIIGNLATGLTIGNCVIENSEMTGTHQQGLAIRNGSNVYGNTIHDVSSAMLGVGNLIHDNTFYNVGYTPLGDHSGNWSFDPAYHTNLMYVMGSATVYNNRFYQCRMPTNYYLEPCVGGFHDTITAYNNVGVVDSTGGGAAIYNIDTEGGNADGCGTWNIYNSTLERNDGGNYVIITKHPYKPGNVTIRNLHIITEGNALPSCADVTGTCVMDHNLVQTHAQAAAQGYLANGFFAPTSGSGGTVDGGVNLSGVFITDIAGVTRPQGAGWDVGAYEYVATGIADRGLRNADYPATLPLLPNPIKTALLKQYLQTKRDLKVYDLAGRAIDQNILGNGGIYLVQEGINKVAQKVIVIK